MSQVSVALRKLFERHRIILWYDGKHELRAEFDAVDLPGVEKIELRNNQFAVKHRILRQEPGRKFLLYHNGPPPADADNWLLDVQLAHAEFRADQAALWLAELGLGFEFAGVVADHAEFFRSARRRQALRQALLADDTASQVRLKMLAICANTEPRLDEVLEALLGELAEDREERIRLVQRSNLAGFLWQQVERAYGYVSTTPGVRDFAIELFKSCYAAGLGEPARLGNDALVFMRRWKNTVNHQVAFETLSDYCSGILGIENDLHGREYRRLVELDLFEVIDRKIVADLVRDVAQRTLAPAAVEQIVRRRRQSHWRPRYHHLYEAIDHAARFLAGLDSLDLTVRSVADGVTQYSRTWYAFDQHYRKFIHHANQAGQPTLLASLASEVELRYSNQFLLKLNNAWQTQVDACARWDAPGVPRQQAFYESQVGSYLRKSNKVFVVISDALRYEVADELLRLIRQEDRYEAALEPALAMLPSFTQLGMAALLPHQGLAIAPDGASVLVDGASSLGIEQRKKILEQASAGKATAIRAVELLALGKEESRALIRDYDLVYVYHNRIDATGDKRETEGQVFEAVEATLEELVKIVKKLANANANNILVTADHGFIYQNQVLDDSDFAAEEPQGRQIVRLNRRFVLGYGLHKTSSFKYFTAEAAGRADDLETLLPKSINRLRVSGAGSRYVHGGAALQEVVIPILQINKKRQSDIGQVGVEILRSGSAIITTGQLGVTLYQSEAVADKLQPRTLRAGIYTAAGELISDRHELRFDSAAENPRARETVVRFVLTSQAEAANNQEVVLRLDEAIPDTSHYREYRSARYLLRRSFASDFEM